MDKGVAEVSNGYGEDKMKTYIRTEDGRIQGCNLTLNVGETLVLLSALKNFAETSEYHQVDKDTAREMVKDLYVMYGIEE